MLTLLPRCTDARSHTHAYTHTQEHKDDTVIVVCGDPVAYPGNEAKLGMMTVCGVGRRACV